MMEEKKIRLELFRYLGPGLLVTVGFIDPGNWASNLAAGSNYGYTLLWMVTLSTIMLIILQHNSAHLGIVSGLCLSEAAAQYLRPLWSRLILSSGILAVIATAFAEILGGAIALQMLFGINIRIGALITAVLVSVFLFTNGYRKIEKLIVALVSIIGLCFLFELYLVPVDWGQVAIGSISPSMPEGSMTIIMSVLGAVVMPHNLFLHSEIIQSRHWNLENEKVIERQLRYEFFDTLFSMLIGWAINSAIIIVAAAVFFKAGIGVNDMTQAGVLLEPLLGKAAALVFGIALLFSGFASSITAAIAGGTVFAGIVHEPYDETDWHTRIGQGLTLLGAVALVFFVTNPFKGLIYSQVALSIQLPITIFLQIYLSSSTKVMGKWANERWNKILLILIGLAVSFLNVMLLIELFEY